MWTIKLLKFLSLCFVISAESANSTLKKIDYAPTGRLTKTCVAHYQKLFFDIPSRPPPRNYLYFHEAGVTDSSAMTSSVETEDNFSFRIVGGKQISIQQAPYQVMYGQYCGGALLSPIWVITAAHCKDKTTYISVGTTRRMQGKQYPVCGHFIHPGYFNKEKPHPFDYDYQLLLLEYAVPVTDVSRPVAIGTFEDLRPGSLLAVSGWGHLTYNSRMSITLNRVHVPLLKTEDCLALGPQYNITDRLFCAGIMDGHKDACQGDSGGPVVVNGFLVGTVSFGIGCGLKNKPGVYANLPMVRDWIRHVTALPL